MLVEQQYQEMEVWYPVYRLREAGCKVILVGPEAGQTYPSKMGYPAKSDKAARTSTPTTSTSSSSPADSPRTSCAGTNRFCGWSAAWPSKARSWPRFAMAPGCCARRKHSRARQATCFSAIKDDVSNAGARYVDMEVVRDGNLITSRKPDDLPAFLQNILQAAKELKPAAMAVSL